MLAVEGGGAEVEQRHVCPWREMAIPELGVAGSQWEDSPAASSGDPRGWKPGRMWVEVFPRTGAVSYEVSPGHGDVTKNSCKCAGVQNFPFLWSQGRVQTIPPFWHRSLPSQSTRKEFCLPRRSRKSEEDVEKSNSFRRLPAASPHLATGHRTEMGWAETSGPPSGEAGRRFTGWWHSWKAPTSPISPSWCLVLTPL